MGENKVSNTILSVANIIGAVLHAWQLGSAVLDLDLVDLGSS